MKKGLLLLAFAFVSKLTMAGDLTAVVTSASPGSATGAINLTVTVGIAAYTFSWAGPGGFTATTEDISNLYAGNYSVTVTDMYCGIAKMTILVDSSTTGVSELTPAPLAVSVYPNPANAQVTIRANHPLERARIVVSDMAGRMVFGQENISGEQKVLDLSGIPAGAYLVEVKEAGRAGRVILLKTD